MYVCIRSSLKECDLAMSEVNAGGIVVEDESWWH